MNCECIYYSKGATRDDLLRLADEIKKAGQYVEIYPLAISRMDERCKCYDDYDGWGQSKTIPKYVAVLFVGGKYHYMNSVRVGHRVFKPWFPDEEPIFTDLHTFDEDD